MSAGFWPDVDELKTILDVDPQSAVWDITLARVMASAINQVKSEVGQWDDVLDVPDDNLAQAALRMAELMALRPEAAAEALSDPTYQRLIFGHRRRFGIA